MFATWVVTGNPMLEMVSIVIVVIAVPFLVIKGRAWYRRRTTKRAAERFIKNLVDFSRSIR
jgi:hypothetical protein